MKRNFSTPNRSWIEGDEVVVSAKYSEAYVQDCRAIEGRRYRNSDKTNIFPLSAAPDIKVLCKKWNIPMQDEVQRADGDGLYFTLSKHPYQIYVKDKNVWIVFDFNEKYQTELKNCAPGTVWDDVKRAYKSPLKNLTEIAKFGSRNHFIMAPDLAEEGRKAQEETAKMIEASRAVDANIEIPGLVGELHPYQKAGVAYISKVRRGFIADAPGVGKTLQALSAAILNDATPTVIVCGKTAKLVWQYQIGHFFPGKKATVLVGKAQKDIEQSDFIIVSYDTLSGRVPDIIAHGYCSVICDESHALQNGDKKSKCPHCKSRVRSNAKNCPSCKQRIESVLNDWGVKRVNSVMGLIEGLDADGMVMLLTGNPITSRPSQLIPQLEAVGQLKAFGGKWKFIDRYEPERGRAQNTVELHNKLRETCMVRRTRRDVYDEEPMLVSAYVPLEVDPKLLKWYCEVEDDVVGFFANKAADAARAAGEDGNMAFMEKAAQLEPHENMIKITALRDAVSKIKLPAVIEWMEAFMEELGEEGKMLGFGEHIELVDGVWEHFGDMAVKIRGGVSDKGRSAAVDRFQNDPSCRLFVANVESASEALTLTAAYNLAFFEPFWTPTRHEQCASRCYGRTNDPHGATAHYLMVHDTIDSMMFDLLDAKAKTVAAVVDGVDPEGKNAPSIANDLVAALMRKGMAK